MTRKYKRLEELEIWDDFMFGAVMSNKEHSPKENQGHPIYRTSKNN